MNLNRTSALSILALLLAACGAAVAQTGTWPERPITMIVPFPPGGLADTVARPVAEAMGRELSAIGIDLDFAPVLDVWANPRNEVIADRAFGTSAPIVARMGVAAMEGLRRGGVLPCGKHFPGHGRTFGDSHKVLPRVAASRAALAKVDLIIDKINAGHGTIGQLLVNPQLYDTLNGATSEMQQLLKDIRANPKKFLRVKLALF